MHRGDYRAAADCQDHDLHHRARSPAGPSRNRNPARTGRSDADAGTPACPAPVDASDSTTLPPAPTTRAEGDAHFQSSFAAPACVKLILPREAGKGDRAQRGGRGFGGAARFILPREAGKGDHAKHGGRGFGINAGTSFQTNLLAARPLHRASARSPSPAARGRISVSGLAAHPCARVMPATTRKKKDRGRRSAERRMPSIVRAFANKCTQYAPLVRCADARQTGRARLPALRRGLATPVATSIGSAPGRVSWDPAPAGVTRLRLSQSSALRADRSFCRTNGVQGRPGAECKSARGHRIPLRVQACLAKATLG